MDSGSILIAPQGHSLAPDAAALAVVVIEDVGDVVVTGLNHGVVRAHTVAVVALQAVAAGHAAASFKQGVFFR